MDDHFKIYIEQLREGHEEAISESFSPEFLDIHEKDLKFLDPVQVKGEAYLAEDVLVLHLDIHTFCVIPCSICNEPVQVDIAVQGVYHTIPLDEIKGGVFNFKEDLREIILLETPARAECSGSCPQRKPLEKFFHSSEAPDGKNKEEGYKPFANLDIDPD